MKFVKVALLISLLLPALCLANETVFEKPIEGEICVETAYAREDHTNRAKKTATLEGGDIVDILSEWKGDDKLPWYKVNIDGAEGWIYGQFVRRLDGGGEAVAPPAPSKTEEPDPNYLVVEVVGVGNNRSQAIEQAWLEAVRQTVGMIMDSKTEVKDDKLSEKIIAYSRGVVEKYDVISVDDSQAAKGKYTVKIRAYVRKESLQQGYDYVAKGGQVVDLLFQEAQPPLDAQALESADAKSGSAAQQVASAPELLKSLLERFNPVDFLEIKIAGKVKPVEGVDESYELDAELSFNSDHFYKNFVPELTRLFDQIAASKKRVIYKDKKAVAEIRSMRDKKSVPNLDQSLLHRYAREEFKDKFQILVPENLDKFAYTLYSFRDELIPQIAGNNGILSDYINRALTVRGVVLKFLDKDGEEVSYHEQPVIFRYLLDEDLFREKELAFHPSILKYSSSKSGVPFFDENPSHKFAVKFDMPKEILNTVKNVKIELMVAPNSVETKQALRIAPREALRKIGWIGMSWNNNRVITHVWKGSPAELAGFRPGIRAYSRFRAEKIDQHGKISRGYFDIEDMVAYVRVNVGMEIEWNTHDRGPVKKLTISPKPLSILREEIIGK